MVVACDDHAALAEFIQSHPLMDKDSFRSENNSISANIAGKLPLNIFIGTKEKLRFLLFDTTGNPEHIRLLKENYNWKENIQAKSEEEIYASVQLPYFEPELREGAAEFTFLKDGKLPVLVTDSDLKGILHNHSTYSDGAHTLEEMAVYCKELGYQYLGICDHSKTAFYANGLQPERILQQHQEIEKLNASLAPFKIFKRNRIRYPGGWLTRLSGGNTEVVRFYCCFSPFHPSGWTRKNNATTD